MKRLQQARVVWHPHSGQLFLDSDDAKNKSYRVFAEAYAAAISPLMHCAVRADVFPYEFIAAAHKALGAPGITEPIEVTFYLHDGAGRKRITAEKSRKGFI